MMIVQFAPIHFYESTTSKCLQSAVSKLILNFFEKIQDLNFYEKIQDFNLNNDWDIAILVFLIAV